MDRGEAECGGRNTPGGVALGIAGISAVGSAALFATTDTGGFAPDNGRILAVFLLPVAIGYTVDGLNALSDAHRCRAYRDHRRALDQATSGR